jgi:hypothetical protein
MNTNNFVQTEEASHRIIIGIKGVKNEKIIFVDWGNLFEDYTPESYPKELEKYLKKAIKFLHKAEGK